MRLRILSYNIHHAVGIDRRFRLERIIRVLDHHRADVILLQEVDVGVPRSMELNVAREIAEGLGFPHFALGLNVALRRGAYGNATLSRHPIARQRNIDLTVGSRKRRGCLHTTVDVPLAGGLTRPLQVFNIHLGLSARERLRQAGILVRSEEFDALDRQAPCLVGGDFNEWGNRLSSIFIEILGFCCATGNGNAPGNQKAIPTYPSFSPTRGLDKVFCRGAVRVLDAQRCQLQVARVASDHLPVAVDLELEA